MKQYNTFLLSLSLMVALAASSADLTAQFPLSGRQLALAGTVVGACGLIEAFIQYEGKLGTLVADVKELETAVDEKQHEIYLLERENKAVRKIADDRSKALESLEKLKLLESIETLKALMKSADEVTSPITL